MSASLPIWHADRRPYPRALVDVPESLWVSDDAGNPTTSLPVNEVWGAPVDPGGDDCSCRADGTCDEDPPPEGTVCEYKLGLKAAPGNQPPTWNCEDDGGGTGFQLGCTWPHSSAGKDYLGKGLSCEDLPAFEVTASVPYWWSFARQWEEWEQVGEDCDCSCKVCEDPNGCSDECDCHGPEDNLCVEANEFCDKECDPIYDWKHHGPDWELMDLTDYGWPTPYMINSRVQLAGYRACGPHPVGVIHVPCIEVQGVISNPKEP